MGCLEGQGMFLRMWGWMGEMMEGMFGGYIGGWYRMFMDLS